MTRAIQIEDNLIKITNDAGDSVYQSSCEAIACGMPILMLTPERPYICRECEIAYLNEIREGRMTSLDDLPIIRDPQYLLAPLAETRKYISGPCKYHMECFGEELTVERNVVASKGYFVCLDCRKKKQAEYDATRQEKKYAV